MLGAAAAAGLNSAGIDVTTLGVAPTPAVSFAARTGGFGLGVVISASHNPPEDNGIKFLGASGSKLCPESETEIEGLLNESATASGKEIGRLEHDASSLQAYVDTLAGLLPERLDGFRLALDCANGAASYLAPELLRRLGAELVTIGCEPDGDNINVECGATRPGCIQEVTVEAGAALGVAFDGDADRCVFSDERGGLINGDRMMGIWAAFQKSWNGLEPPVVVGTVMSNMGFENALEELGIRLERTPVGDRHVASRIEETQARIGGEQSGHIIFRELTPTGDGLLTAVQLLRVLKLSGCAASELPPHFENRPQLLVNVRVDDKDAWRRSAGVQSALKDAERIVNGDGRVLVRASGTQPVVRVMVESRTEEARDKAAERIVEALVREAGGEVQSRVDLTDALGD